MAVTFQQYPNNQSLPIITNWTPMIGYMVYSDDDNSSFFYQKLLLTVRLGTSTGTIIAQLKQRRNGYSVDIAGNKARAFFDLREIANSQTTDTYFDQNCTGAPFQSIHGLGASTGTNASGETLINHEDLEIIIHDVQDPIYRTGYDRNFWIWEKFQEGVPYILSADVARGDGADFSCFHIVRVDTMTVVAEYQGKPDLDMYSRILYDAGTEYGTCLLVVENVGVGIAVLEKLKDMQYKKLYYSIKSTHEYVEAYLAEHDERAVPGFTTSTKTRPLIVAKLEEYVRNKLITMHSSRVFHELKTFVWVNGKPQAMRSYNDDLVMSLAIACWVRDTALSENERDMAYKKAMLGGVFKSTTTMNTQIKGQKFYNETFNEKHQEEIQKTKDFLWIYKG